MSPARIARSKRAEVAALRKKLCAFRLAYAARLANRVTARRIRRTKTEAAERAMIYAALNVDPHDLLAVSLLRRKRKAATRG